MKEWNIQTYILIPAPPISFTNKFPQESYDGTHHDHLLPPALSTSSTHSSPPRKFLLTVLRISVHMLLPVTSPILPEPSLLSWSHSTELMDCPQYSDCTTLSSISVSSARLFSSLKAWAMFSVSSTVHDIKDTQDA